jgi:hypothetical protein
MSFRMVSIRTVSNEVEAAIVQAELEASGIPSVISSGGSTNLPHVQFGAGIGIAVPEDRVDDALTALEEVQSAE